MMDLDELRSVQSRERQTDSLQQLRESFYQDAGEFIQQLHRERERAAEEADDPWNAPEVTRLSDDIDTAEQTVEAIYERRVGKIVKMASLAAADMPTEDEGLTTEERTLFETLVDAIERNRANVEAVIDGEDPAEAVADAGAAPDANASSGADVDASDSPHDEASGNLDAPVGGDSEPDGADVPPDSSPTADETRPAPPDGPTETAADASEAESGVDAADLMGGDGADAADAGPDAAGSAAADAAPGSTERAGDRPVPPEDGAGEAGPPAAGSDSSATESADPTADGNGGEGNTDGESAGEAAEADAPAVDRATVRITADVGEIFGVDQRAYDLSTDDVVQLPEANADPLVERDAAERLD